MKKVMLVVFCLMIAAASFAQTSGPSNVAGYVKFSTTFATPGVQSATPFGLPFKFWDVVAGVPQYGTESTNPSDIVGDQAAPGDGISADKIIRQDGGFDGYRDSGAGNAWVGSLETGSAMIPGHAYWYANKTGAARDIVLAGEVDNAGNYGTVSIPSPAVSGNASATPYTWRDSRLVPMDSLGLIEQGFMGDVDAIASDKVIAQVGGAVADHVNGAWVGTLTEVAPGDAYWIVNKHAANTWDYTYVGVPVLPVVARDHEGVVSSVKRSNTSKATDGSRATTSVKAPVKTKSNKAGHSSK